MIYFNCVVYDLVSTAHRSYCQLDCETTTKNVKPRQDVTYSIASSTNSCPLLDLMDLVIMLKPHEGPSGSLIGQSNVVDVSTQW